MIHLGFNLIIDKKVHFSLLSFQLRMAHSGHLGLNSRFQTLKLRDIKFKIPDKQFKI